MVGRHFSTIKVVGATVLAVMIPCDKACGPHGWKCGDLALSCNVAQWCYSQYLIF